MFHALVHKKCIFLFWAKIDLWLWIIDGQIIMLNIIFFVVLQQNKSLVILHNRATFIQVPFPAQSLTYNWNWKHFTENKLTNHFFPKTFQGLDLSQTSHQRRTVGQHLHTHNLEKRSNVLSVFPVSVLAL